MASERPVVLVVEDDAPTRGLLQVLLESAGYSVALADDGAVGLARIEAGGIQLVLLDLMLPALNGRELCQWVRARVGEIYLPIILVTALGTPSDRGAGFAAGADDYITKPFDTDDVLNRVRVWIQTRQRLETAHAQLVAHQEELRAVERAARDETIVTLARTISHELLQPVAALVGWLELQKAGMVKPEETDRMWIELEQAVTELWARSARLSRLTRYEIYELAGLQLIDLDRAQASGT